MSAAVLDRERAALVVVDVQQAFRGAVLEFDRVAARAAVLTQGARILGIPVIVTEQYPRGLGDTVTELIEHLEGVPRLAKTSFSALGADGFDLRGRDQVIVCGIEAHVCVSQTVLGLIAGGVETHVAVDAVSSRSIADLDAGLSRMKGAGAVLSSVEMALLEIVGEAGTAEFKAIQGLIR